MIFILLAVAILELLTLRYCWQEMKRLNENRAAAERTARRFRIALRDIACGTPVSLKHHAIGIMMSNREFNRVARLETYQAMQIIAEHAIGPYIPIPPPR